MWLRALSCAVSIAAVLSITACGGGSSPQTEARVREQFNDHFGKQRQERTASLKQRASMDLACSEGELTFASVRRQSVGQYGDLPFIEDVAGCGKAGRYRYDEQDHAWKKTEGTDEGKQPPKT